MPHRDPRQPFIAHVLEQFEGAFHEFLGSQSRQGAVQAIGMGEEQHVSARVGARKAGARTPVALDELASFATAFDQPGDLLTGIAADPLQEAQHHGLVGALQPGVAEAAHRAGDEAVALFGSHRKVQGHCALHKSPDLGQRMQLLVVHIDHHAPHHDRPQPPVQTQTPLESRPPLRLKPHWTRLRLDCRGRPMLKSDAY